MKLQKMITAAALGLVAMLSVNCSNQKWNAAQDEITTLEKKIDLKVQGATGSLEVSTSSGTMAQVAWETPQCRRVGIVPVDLIRLLEIISNLGYSSVDDPRVGDILDQADAQRPHYQDNDRRYLIYLIIKLILQEMNAVPCEIVGVSPIFFDRLPGYMTQEMAKKYTRHLEMHPVANSDSVTAVLDAYECGGRVKTQLKAGEYNEVVRLIQSSKVSEIDKSIGVADAGSNILTYQNQKYGLNGLEQLPHLSRGSEIESKLDAIMGYVIQKACMTTVSVDY